jgi:hypothetical protein
MLTLLKASTVAAGVVAATVTGIVFALSSHAGPGAASGSTASAGAPAGAGTGGTHHGHHGRHGHHGGSGGTGSGSSGSGGSGCVCTTTEGGWDGLSVQINGDHFNYGRVVLEIRSNDGTGLWSGLVNAGSEAGFPGGALAAQTGIGDCSQVPGTTSNDYAIAYDAVSGRWSNRVPVDSSCASL